MVSLKDINERLKRLEDRSKVNFFEIEKRLSKLETGGGTEELNELKERIAELEDLQMLLELENTKIKEMLSEKELLMKRGIGYEDINEKLAELETRIKGLEGKGLRLFSREPSLHVEDIWKKLNELESKIDQEKRFGLFSRKEKDIKDTMKRLERIENEISSLKEKEQSIDSLKGLLKYIASAKDRLNEDLQKAESIVNELQKIRNTREALGIKKGFRLLKAKEPELNTIKNKLDELEQEINKIKTKPLAEDSIKGVMDDVTRETRRLRDEMSTHERELYKLEKEISDMRDYVKTMRGKSRIDVYKIDEIEKNLRAEIKKDLDRSMCEIVDKTISDRLSRFAKEVDRRLPNFVPLDEYKKDIEFLDHKIDKGLSDLNIKINKIQRPDLSLMTKKIEDLEKMIQNMSNTLMGMKSRMPVVVD